LFIVFRKINSRNGEVQEENDELREVIALFRHEQW